MIKPVSLGELNIIYLCEAKGEFVFLYLHALVCVIHNVSEKWIYNAVTSAHAHCIHSIKLAIFFQ